MTRDLDRRAHAVLMKALELDLLRREAFVESACAGEAALAARVRSLLAALDTSHGFLEVPALGRRTWPSSPDSAHHAPRVDGYQVTRVIGSGGMATVYEAVQEQPHRRVALKVMKRGMERTSALQRFRFETEVLARLRHPGIAQIFEAGASHDGHGATVPYFAMELIEAARPITSYADAQQLDHAARLSMVAAVCDAVQHGHQSGVIHRDLKPSNILVDAAGAPKVIDFGVARATDPGQARITLIADAGKLIGTLNYMSPEQCDPAAVVDARCDVYSLGIVLYELVAGRLPHELDRVPVPEALRIVRDVDPQRPSAWNPVCRGDIDAIVMKAIDKEPDRRYATAAALADDIRRYLRSESIEARPPTMFYRWRLFTRRNKTLVAVAAALALAIIGGGVLSAAFGIRAVRESKRRLNAEMRAIKERDAAIWHGYVANIAAAIAAFNGGEVHQTRARLASAASKHRGWEWRFIAALAERPVSSIAAHGDMIFGFDTSRDASRMVTGCRDGSIKIWSTDTFSDPLVIPGNGRRVISVAFSPDASQVVSGGYDRTVRIWDALDGQELQSLGEHPARLGSVAWSPAGLVASASVDGTAIVWDPVTRTQLCRLDDQPRGITGLSFSADGRLMMTWNGSGSLWVRSADGSQVLHRLEMPRAVMCAVTSDDGALLAAGADGGNLAIWDARTGEELHRPRVLGSVSAVRTLSFAPGARLLASGHGDRSISLWSVETGEQQFPLIRGHEEAVAGVRFCPSGTRLLSASWDRTIRVWDLAGDHPAELITTLRGHENRLMTARFSPDGMLLASAGQDRTIRLWDPELARDLGRLPGRLGTVRCVCFSPDGTILAAGTDGGTVGLWSMATGHQVHSQNRRGPTNTIAFSPDGRLLAFSDNRTVRVLDAATMEELRAFQGHGQVIRALAFSPDGVLIASVSNDQTVRLWDVATGEPGRILGRHEFEVVAVTFSPDGGTVYSGGRDQMVRAWSVDTGEVRVLSGHGQFVTSLDFSPDGTRLAAASWFGEIVLWDLPSHEIVLSFKAHPTVVRSVDFDASGRWLASASYDQTVRIYDDVSEPDRSARRARAAAQVAAASVLANQLVLRHGTAVLAAEALASGAESVDPAAGTTAPFVGRELLARCLAEAAAAQPTAAQPAAPRPEPAQPAED